MSSRIIVKNLPKHIDERRFRNHFGLKGEITDVKLLYTNRGKFRRFGYIGYRTEEEAQSACEYFNNSFIDTSKIEVQIARPHGDASLPRAWSIYTQGTSLYNKAHGSKSKKDAQNQAVENKKNNEKTQRAIHSLYDELLASNQDDPRFKEFLQVMAPRAKNRTWTNDDYANWQTDELAAIKGAVAARREQIELQDTDTTKNDETANENSEADGENNDEQIQSAGLSDMDWLRMHMSSKIDEDEVEGSDTQDKTEQAPTVKEEAKPVPANKVNVSDPTAAIGDTIAQIQETGRLFVRNLPYMATEDDLRQAFEPFGPLSEVHMPISKDTKRPKGFAYILYLLPEHAVNAYKALDNKVFLGRLLHVLPGKEKPQPREPIDSLGGFKSGVKKEREAKKKALAGSDFNWNSLFMSADAVADSISERLNISKADLLSADSTGNPAVRLALAETHIINDAKQYFEQHGVLLDQFGNSERSDVVILVKNIPFSVTEDELRSLFGKYGSLGRVLVPPSRTIAIVEFLEPTEARSAFRHLAYKRIKDAPIYLERAPKDVFDTPYDADKHSQPDKPVEDTKAQIEKIHEPVSVIESSRLASQGSSDKGQTGCVLFVKNLNFETTEDTLRRIFNGVDGLASVTIRFKKDIKTQGLLSMGFGFVEYKTPSAAQQALESFQGIEVDGHALVLKISDRLGQAREASDSTTAGNLDGKKPKSTKLVIKNVPFEATRKDIRELVSAFGQVKSVRLPKKFSGGHRGFAFVEFLTPQEAQHVLETMKSTHLYGRHLVLGWAEEENSLQAIREKVGRQFSKDSGDAGATGKRRKIELGQQQRSDESEMDIDSESDLD
ncbi:Multiple RNA-binding domain-containing protein 1 [Coemansia brasiliensis]|uniref:Multiple RNA-binding domain-containing protein 1 n=1 Tax=Coemansia brasiliensis TaxID=2650707 RepID=A0A9W8LY35_9FUNG|nr:Multiple RNA-binding domain-containing protein 1 [Coemansia brasiliensis]